MEASVVFASENKLISLDNKTCILANGKKVSCTKITSCLRYNGNNLPTSIDIDISWILDSKKIKTPRMFFLHDENKNIINSTMRLYRGKSECRTDQVYIAEGVRDKLTALEVEMKYNIRETTTKYSSSSQTRVRRAVLEPVLDQNIGTVRRDSVNIMKNCGKDNICIPDLKLDVKTNEKYILGGNESLIVEVLVTNEGEDAFEAGFYMNLPSGLDYKGTRKISEGSYPCTAPTASTNYTLKCDIGNPLPAGKSVNFKVIFEPSKKAGLTPFYDFYMEANSTNEEAEGSNFDNVYKKSVSISIESDLSISGSSNPSDFHYNVTQFLPFKNATNEVDIGPQVIHIYDIRNTGTSSIEEIELFINWPASTNDGDQLIYLLSQPETQGNVLCEPTQYANLHDLNLDQGLERKSYLDKNRLPIRSGTQGRWSGSSHHRYNSQGGATHEETHFDESESTGDASLVHQNRGQSYHESWRSSSSTTNTGRGGAVSGTTGEVNRDWNTNRINTGSFNWDTQGNRQSGSSGRGSAQFESSSTGGRHASRDQSNRHSSSSSNFESSSTGGRQASREQGRQSESTGFYESSSTGGRQVSREQGGRQSSSTGFYESSSESSSRGQFDSQNRFNSQFESGSGASGVGGGANVREYEYHEQWNSTSVNGGPAITHVSRKNQTFTRGQDGRVLLSETSTETVIAGGFEHGNFDNRNSQDSHYYERSGHTTSSDDEYERRRQEYYENIRRQQEEERRHREEIRRRQQEEQSRAEQERIRLEEERIRLEEERRRYGSSRTSVSSSQGSQGNYRSNTNYDTSYAGQSGSRRSGSSVSGSGGR